MYLRVPHCDARNVSWWLEYNVILDVYLDDLDITLWGCRARRKHSWMIAAAVDLR